MPLSTGELEELEYLCKELEEAFRDVAHGDDITHYLHCKFNHNVEIHKRANELGLTPALLKNEGWEFMNAVDKRFILNHTNRGGTPGRKPKSKVSNCNHNIAGLNLHQKSQKTTSKKSNTYSPNGPKDPREQEEPESTEPLESRSTLNIPSSSVSEIAEVYQPSTQNPQSHKTILDTVYETDEDDEDFHPGDGMDDSDEEYEYESNEDEEEFEEYETEDETEDGESEATTKDSQLLKEITNRKQRWERYQSMTNKDLAKECENYGLTKSGTKYELITRLTYYKDEQEAKMEEWRKGLDSSQKKRNSDVIFQLFRLMIHQMFQAYNLEEARKIRVSGERKKPKKLSSEDLFGGLK